MPLLYNVCILKCPKSCYFCGEVCTLEVVCIHPHLHLHKYFLNVVSLVYTKPHLPRLFLLEK